jgi:peptidoglycan hydrolase-like protein with peptidoglycan-binding domain
MTSHGTARARATLRKTGLATALVVACGLGGSALTGAVASATVTPAPATEAISVIGLREGATGPGVQAVQEKLLGFGYVIREGANGVFGPSTTYVLRAFQSQNGLNPTGVVTENTARYLGLAGGVSAARTNPGSNNSTGGGGAPTVGTSPPASTATSYVGLKRGDTGEAVRQLQLKLLGLQLYLSGGADGVFGSSTETAVRMVQRVNRLPETGVVTAKVAAILGLTGTASASSPGASAGSVLRYGSRGAAVKRIQQLLIKAGLQVVGGADGIFGLNTQRAVRQFQQAQGLPITGQVDAATDAALVRAAGNGGSSGAPTGSGSSAAGYVGLRLGSTGAAVKRVQQAIMATGLFLRGGADGIFGNATYNALVRYQKAKGLTASGVVDAATARAMGLAAGSGSSAGGLTGGGSTAAGYAVYDERGSRVVALQKALMAAGIPLAGGADGVFGSGTLGAVRAFQQAKGLVATGKVDQATATALGLAPLEKPTTPTVTGVQLQASPIGGNCWYSDTWQASRGGGRLHLGVDIGAAMGTPVRAVVAGRISYQYHDRPGSLSGNALKVSTADGTYVFYAHLDGFAPGIGVGSTVTAGQIIGYVGKTGNAGIPHLHLEVHPGGGSAVNPYPYVKAVGCS